MILDQLSGLTVELVDSLRYEHFTFLGSKVTASLGEKGGAICAPVLEVCVNAQQELTFTGANVELSWSKLVIQDHELVVVRNGQPAIYKILSRHSPRKRYLP
ncbi:MAG TPA: hypothetical protein PLM98_09695 [Thiolinea sp.]|nr:hypothetical protein [Thiolinea sp.]